MFENKDAVARSPLIWVVCLGSPFIARDSFGPSVGSRLKTILAEIGGGIEQDVVVEGDCLDFLGISDVSALASESNRFQRYKDRPFILMVDAYCQETEPDPVVSGQTIVPNIGDVFLVMADKKWKKDHVLRFGSGGPAAASSILWDAAILGLMGLPGSPFPSLNEDLSGNELQSRIDYAVNHATDVATSIIFSILTLARGGNADG